MSNLPSSELPRPDMRGTLSRRIEPASDPRLTADRKSKLVGQAMTGRRTPAARLAQSASSGPNAAPPLFTEIACEHVLT